MRHNVRYNVARALLSAANVLGGGRHMDPMTQAVKLNRRLRSLQHILTFYLRGAMGNKITVHVFFGGGGLRYEVVGPRGVPYALKNLQIRQKLPQDVDGFSSVGSLGRAIKQSLDSGTARVISVKKYEELD